MKTTEETKLYKCWFCGEWFNTTNAIMEEHCKIKHNVLWPEMKFVKIKLTCNITAFEKAMSDLNKGLANASVKLLCEGRYL